MTTETASACPLEYRYGPSAFKTAQTNRVHTAYVVGGLYGNVPALQAIEAMQAAEQAQGRAVTLVFNGDYNWFNTDEASFVRVNQAALRGLSIRGNVEAEMNSPTDEGCGCNYPDYFNAEYVERSNAIMSLLRKRARQHPSLCDSVAQLPYIRVLEIGACRIGIVHGDAQSLSGWDFAAERLSPTGICCSGDNAGTEQTSLELIEHCFRQAGVDAFASTHTCLPHAHDYCVDGKARLIINNGSAGMPNFAGSDFGLITRISEDASVPAGSLYGIEINGVRFDAIPVQFNKGQFLECFNQNWPEGSPARIAYEDRLLRGPAFTLKDAVGGNVRTVSMDFTAQSIS
jgi:hypothetical protein